MPPLEATFTLWGLWFLSWIVAAYWSDRAEKRTARGEAWLYRIVTVVGGFLLFGDSFRLLLFREASPLAPSTPQLWSLSPAAKWGVFVIVLLGLAFAWWARLYLGRLWSSSVTKKANHHIVDSGPYGIVRHPIYTGILLAAVATAVELGSVGGVAGALAFGIGFWIKARLEERFLGEQLGVADYDAYRRRVPMLIPLGPRG
jgi:protein-S-isoprenylcysteine O-methyltransferase Ste14